MKFRAIEEVMVIIDSVLNTKRELDLQLLSDIPISEARGLAIKYWSLISTIDECILSADNSNRELETNSKLQYSRLLSLSKETSESGKKRECDNNPEYILAKDKLNSGELYKNYLKNLREDIFAGHYLMKTCYERGVEIYLASPKTEN